MPGARRAVLRPGCAVRWPTAARELESIVDKSRYDNAIDPVFSFEFRVDCGARSLISPERIAIGIFKIMVA